MALLLTACVSSGQPDSGPEGSSLPGSGPEDPSRPGRKGLGRVVPFCELMAILEEKPFRIHAVYRSGFEESVLVDPNRPGAWPRPASPGLCAGGHVDFDDPRDGPVKSSLALK